MSVPLREADAATLPGWFSATQAISLWWALMVKGADDVPGLVLDKSWSKHQFVHDRHFKQWIKWFIYLFALCVFVTYNQLQAATFMTWKDQQLFLQTGT